MLLLIRIGDSAWREVRPTPPDKFQQNTWLLYSNEAGGRGLTWGDATRGVHQSERKTLNFYNFTEHLHKCVKCNIAIAFNALPKLKFKVLVASVCQMHLGDQTEEQLWVHHCRPHEIE